MAYSEGRRLQPSATAGVRDSVLVAEVIQLDSGFLFLLPASNGAVPNGTQFHPLASTPDLRPGLKNAVASRPERRRDQWPGMMAVLISPPRFSMCRSTF